jgi:hypothetical protein
MFLNGISVLLASSGVTEQTNPPPPPSVVREFLNDKSPMTSLILLGTTEPRGVSELVAARLCLLTGTVANPGNGDPIRTRVLRSCGIPKSWSDLRLRRTDCLCSSSLNMLVWSRWIVEPWSKAGDICKTVKFGLKCELVTESMISSGDRNDSNVGMSLFPGRSLKCAFSPATRAIFGWPIEGRAGGTSL